MTHYLFSNMATEYLMLAGTAHLPLQRHIQLSTLSAPGLYSSGTPEGPLRRSERQESSGVQQQRPCGAAH